MATMTQCAADLSAYLDADIPAFIWGKPGVGKSDVVRQCARARGVPLIDWRAVLRDPVDVRGLPVPDLSAGFTRWLPASDLPNADRDGPEGILFMDELNAAGPMMQAACFGLVLDRRVADYVLPPGWRIVAAGNRIADRAAAQRMPTALRNRFAHIEAELDATGAEWAAWAAANNVHPAVIAFVRFRPMFLHVMPGDKLDNGTVTNADASAFPTPRSWAQVSKVVDMPDAQRFRLVAGLIGPEVAGEFEAFLRLWRSLPSIPDIIANPSTARVPSSSEPGLCYAVSAALARYATPRDFAAILEYAARLPREYEIVTAVDATRRTPGLKDTAAFVQWCIRNADVTI